MYTRDFGMPENDGLIIPEAYSGVAFGEEENQGLHKEEECMAEPGVKPREKDGLLSGISRFIPSGLFSGIKLPFVKDGGFKLGTEELLIAAIALFLFFSKDGDRECALILFFLLFV